MDRQALTELLRLILIAFVIAFVINLVRVLIFSDWHVNNFNNNHQTVEQTRSTDRQSNLTGQNNNARLSSNNSDEVYIELAPMEEFSGLTKAEILQKRTDAVLSSPIFRYQYYTPSPEVYMIDDGMPWISAYAALHWKEVPKSEVPNGVSRDSRGILNPELLFDVVMCAFPNIIPNYDNKYDKDLYFIPYKVVYNSNTNTITAYIKNFRNKDFFVQEISLSDVNAHDLGYRYAFMDEFNNITFYQKNENNNISTQIYRTNGYYMHGSVCGVVGGCNNYAPYQPQYQFYLQDLPASVNIKLWEAMPSNKEQKADLNYRIVFE